MKAKPQYAVVFVTAPDLKIARKLAKRALKARLAACANIITGMESHYWWQGKIESGKEVLMIFKTTRANLEELQALVKAKHPYDTPEFLVLPVVGGSAKYLRWIDESINGSAT
jgi:periplasmic divalent cation tolerance protein